MKRSVSFRNGATNADRIVPLNDSMKFIGGTEYVNSDLIEMCLAKCNELVAEKGTPILFVPPLLLEHQVIQRLQQKNWKMMGQQNFTFATARYVFFAINTLNHTHWEAVLMDVRKREMFVFDSLTNCTKDYEYFIYANTKTYNEGMDNYQHMFVKTAVEPGIVPRELPAGEDESLKNYLGKIITWYNSYASFMKDMYTDSSLPISTTYKTSFRVYLKPYVETQILNNCGVYVMSLAYHLAKADDFVIPEHWYRPNFRCNITRRQIEYDRRWMTKQFVYGWSYKNPILIDKKTSRIEAVMHRMCYRLCNCICMEGGKRYSAKPVAVGSQGESTPFTQIFNVAFKAINPQKARTSIESIQKVIRLITTEDLDTEPEPVDYDVYIILCTLRKERGFEYKVKFKGIMIPLAAWRFFDNRYSTDQDMRMDYMYRGFIQ